MDNPQALTFFLSYPRCRTAWLATYLTGMGVYCFHELWRTCHTIDAVKQAMQAKGPGPVANADPTNWIFIEELVEAFPDAVFIEITRPVAEVKVSCDESYGEGDYHELWAAYERMRSYRPPSCVTIDFDQWDELTSRQLFTRASGGTLPFNQDWHDRLHQLHIQLTEARIDEDHELASHGESAHILNKIQQYAGGVAWDS